MIDTCTTHWSRVDIFRRRAYFGQNHVPTFRGAGGLRHALCANFVHCPLQYPTDAFTSTLPGTAAADPLSRTCMLSIGHNGMQAVMARGPGLLALLVIFASSLHLAHAQGKSSDT